MPARWPARSGPSALPSARVSLQLEATSALPVTLPRWPCAPEDSEAHAARRDVYRAWRERELSQMAKGIYGAAAEESAKLADGS
jgi:hypothetical protein